MTVQEALDKAREEGYQETTQDGALRVALVDQHTVTTVQVEEIFLDPEFWQVLGRALGWENDVMTVHTVENGRPTIVTRAGHHWHYYWHRFFDCLAEGKTPEAFFESLADHA